MDDLLNAMATEMKIDRYTDETDTSFVYRLCYSSLGQWCLLTAQNRFNDIEGTSKHNQTIVINELIQRYSELYPDIAEYFIDSSEKQESFAVHIRKIYEETGYLFTDDNNQNRLSNINSSIRVGDSFLYTGTFNKECFVSGLGVFSTFAEKPLSSREFLIRDELICEEFFQEQFNIIDFSEKDIDINELYFFNPCSHRAPSRSWLPEMNTDYTVARCNEYGPYYRVIRESDGVLLFADENIEPHNRKFTSYEYRRLYFAIKAHYKSPLKAWVNRIDNKYSTIRIGGHLPNREYYYMLLLAWPYSNAFDKTYFCVRNDFLPEISKTLENIGIKFIGG